MAAVNGTGKTIQMMNGTVLSGVVNGSMNIPHTTMNVTNMKKGIEE